MQKIAGLSGALGIVLAVVAGVVPIPGLDVALVLLALGIIAGSAAPQDGAMRIYLAVLVLPAIAAGVGAIPAVGEHLGAMFGNLAVVVTGSAASLAARRAYEMVMDSVKGMTSGS